MKNYRWLIERHILYFYSKSRVVSRATSYPCSSFSPGPRNQIFPFNSILFARLHRLKLTAIILVGMTDTIDRSNRGNNVSDNVLTTLTSARMIPMIVQCRYVQEIPFAPRCFSGIRDCSLQF